MRPSSMTSVPGDRMRSGRTSAAPDRTITGGRAWPSRAPMAAASAPSVAVAIVSASIIGRGRRRAISTRIGSSSRSAADAMMPPSTSISGSAKRDEIGRRHAEILRRVAHDRDRDAVVPARGVEHVFDGDGGEVAVHHVQHARPIAGLDAPDQPAHDAGRGHFRLEAAGLPVVLALDRIERQPRDVGGASARAELRHALPDDAAGRVIVHGKEHDVLHALRRADPRLGHRRAGARRRAAPAQASP